MKLASYRLEGHDTYGVVVGDSVTSLPMIDRTLPPTLRGALGLGVDALMRVPLDHGESRALAEVTLLPVIPDPRKILCAGVNYHTHREETGRPMIEFPTIFTRFADTLVAAGQPAAKPPMSERFDYEGELAVIIGRECWRVDESSAMSCVAGYSCFNDLTARDWQRHSAQWTPGKNFPATGAFGPWLVTLDEVSEPMVLETFVNGELRQKASTAEMIFSVSQLIAYISTFTALAPGDVIVSGTPGGVGMFREPPTFLLPGEQVDVIISDVGRLENLIS